MFLDLHRQLPDGGGKVPHLGGLIILILKSQLSDSLELGHDAKTPWARQPVRCPRSPRLETGMKASSALALIQLKMSNEKKEETYQ